MKGAQNFKGIRYSQLLPGVEVVKGLVVGGVVVGTYEDDIAVV